MRRFGDGDRRARPRRGGRKRPIVVDLGGARRRPALARLAPEPAADPRLLLAGQAERDIAEDQAGEREQEQDRDPDRPGDRRVADQVDGGIDAVRRGEADRSAPAAGQARDRRPAGQAERDSEEHGTERGNEQPAADPPRRLEPEHPHAGERDDRQEQDAANSEQEQQRIAGVGARASQPVARRAAGGGAQRRVGGAVGGERDRPGEADGEEQRAPGADGKALERGAQRVAPVWRQVALGAARCNRCHVPPPVNAGG